MIVMYGSGTLVLGVTEDQIVDLQKRLTLTYFGDVNHALLVHNVVIFLGKDRAEVLAQVQAAGIPSTTEFDETFLRGGRTDRAKGLVKDKP